MCDLTSGPAQLKLLTATANAVTKVVNQSAAVFWDEFNLFL